MKLFIIVVVSMIVCCNAQDDSLRAVQLLEAILNETKATRQLQNELLEDIRNETRTTRELQYQLLSETKVIRELSSNETRAARELQYQLLNEAKVTRELLKDIHNETRVARDQSLKKCLAQENTWDELIDKVELVAAELENIGNQQHTQLATLIDEAQNTRLGQNTCCNITNDSLGHIYNELHSTRQETQDCCEVAQQWYTQPNVFPLFASCEDIKTMSPSAPSGYYNITKYDGTTQRVYCDMEHSHRYLCGSTGWARVAYLDMSDPSQRCPAELRLYSEGACGKQYYSYGCNSVTFSTNGIRYSQVCGRVIGYQYGHTDAFNSYSIDGPYVEGISITHGSPRQHIWTLAAGYDETGTSSIHCPCNTGSTTSVPSFVGDDYFCESGTSSSPASQLYTDDPLWDGEGCGGDEGPCCNVPGIPWFHKVLNSSTTDDVELRVCASFSAEDAPVSLYELYVK